MEESTANSSSMAASTAPRSPFSTIRCQMSVPTSSRTKYSPVSRFSMTASTYTSRYNVFCETRAIRLMSAMEMMSEGVLERRVALELPRRIVQRLSHPLHPGVCLQTTLLRVHADADVCRHAAPAEHAGQRQGSG